MLSIFCVPSGIAQVWITPRVPKLLDQGRILEVVRVLGLLLGVEVVERAEEFVEAVRGGQRLVGVAQVVLAELRGRVALCLEELRPIVTSRACSPSLAPAGRLSGCRCGSRLCPVMKRGAAGGAALLAVPVGEHRAFLGDAVDVGRLVAHHGPGCTMLTFQ